THLRGKLQGNTVSPGSRFGRIITFGYGHSYTQENVPVIPTTRRTRETKKQWTAAVEGWIQSPKSVPSTPTPWVPCEMPTKQRPWTRRMEIAVCRRLVEGVDFVSFAPYTFSII
ncbi:unnamed protein product, partial [Ectocarpus sp. 12 AP-2014]